MLRPKGKARQAAAILRAQHGSLYRAHQQQPEESEQKRAATFFYFFNPCFFVAAYFVALLLGLAGVSSGG